MDAQLYWPGHITVDAEGNYYITEYYSNRIRKVDTKGIISTVAGNTSEGYSGDGGLAVNAKLNDPYDVAVDGKGNLYIADFRNHRVRKVDRLGIITTVVGTGVQGYSGDGGPPEEAQLSFPYSVATDTDGNLYVADASHRVRKVSACGVITTVAGNGYRGYSGDGGPATEARLNYPHDVSVDSQGNLYIADYSNNRIRKVDTSGIITTVAGNGSLGYGGDGGPATAASIGMPYEIAVDDAGNIYIADFYNLRIRKVDSSGYISTIAGNGVEAFPYDLREGITATEANVNWPTGVAIDPAGNLYFTDDNRIRQVALPSIFSNRVSCDDIVFVEKDGTAHVMSDTGRHERTIDVNTGISLYSFDYDVCNNLTAFTDRFANITRIERDVNGIPNSIISPDGLTTGLDIDGNNHLVGIIYPDGRAYEFEYTADGLLLAKTEPEGNRYEHGFDDHGRLTDAMDEEGGHWQYTRTILENGDILSESLTGEGNRVSYLDHTYSTGKYTSTITGPTGEITQYSQAADGLSVAKSLSCGMDIAFIYDIDPEYKFKYVKTMTETTPGSLTCVTNRDRVYQDTDRDNIPDLITDTITVNGNTTKIQNNILQSRKSVTSQQGRTIRSSYNPNNLLPTTLSIPGFHTTCYGYDERGRLTSLNTGSRNSSFTYDSNGFLASSTGPEGYTAFYEHDPTGRLIGMNRPDGSSLFFTYDGNGNMEVLTTPSDVDHIFGYNRVNKNDYYQTPLSGGYRYVYDRDRRLVCTEFPSGSQISNIYDKTRLMQIRTPEGTIDYTYLCGTKVGSVSKGTDAIVYEYDGKLVLAETLNGTINETLSYGYNNDFNMIRFTYAGGSEQYSYDDDGLLIGAGQFSIGRNAGNGLPESVSGNGFSLNRTFNGYGEVDTEECVIAGHYLSEWDAIRNSNGRIMGKSETIGSISSSCSYTYDALGRLLTVSQDGTLVEEYRYAPNGTRTYEMNALRGIGGRTFGYSDEDHLLTAGDTTYEYNLDGFLTIRTDGTGGTTYFDYSTRGELLEVVLPDGRTIEYLHDPLGRRIAKKVNGTITEKYLWQGLTKLLAVYDGNDNLMLRFEYADGRMPVAMTGNGTTCYLAYDQVGSLRIIGDSTGNVVKQIDYDSFGNIINDSNPAFRIPFGFAGGLHDRDTGLVRFGYRDYDPDTGRWTAKDPILFAGGDTDLYGYCVGDPVNLVDPEGEFAVVSAIAIGLSALTTADFAVVTFCDYKLFKMLEQKRQFYNKQLSMTDPCSEQYRLLEKANERVVLQQATIAEKVGMNLLSNLIGYLKPMPR